MNPPKRQQRKPSTSMHINLPPPDLSSFRPGAGPGAQQPGPSNTQRATMPPPPVQPAYILSKEIQQMEEALKGTTLKLAEIFRYQSDVKRVGSNTQPPSIPAALTAGLGHEVQRFDQLCDVVEARLLHALKVLNRDAKREAAKEKAIKLAEEQARAEQEKELASAAREAADTAMSDGDGAPKPQEIIPSDAITSVSLSALPAVANESAAQPNQSPVDTASSRANRFSLKLDLSSVALQAPADLDQSQPVASPVTIAPKTARPRADDPMGGLSFVGTGGFGGPVGQFSSAAPSFNGAGIQLSGGPGPVGSDPTLLPDFLALVAQQQNNAVPTSLPNSNYMPQLQVAPSAQQSNTSGTSSITSMPNANAIDIIDLTQSTPVAQRSMNLPMSINADGTETIDLTLDSPPIPLATIVNLQAGVKDAGQGQTGEVPKLLDQHVGFGLGLEGANDTANNGGIGVIGTDSVLAALGNGESGISESLSTAGTSSAPTNTGAGLQGASSSLQDATSLLETLTAATKSDPSQTTTDNNNKGNGGGILANNPLEMADLSLPDLPLGMEPIDMSDMPMNLDNLGDINMGMDGLDMDMFGSGLDFNPSNTGSGSGPIDFGAAIGVADGGDSLGMGGMSTGLEGLDMMEDLTFLDGISGAGTGVERKDGEEAAGA